MDTDTKTPEGSAGSRAAAGSAEWTYSHYRATLRRNGEFFAIVTPDGRNDLSPEKARILLDALNALPPNATGLSRGAAEQEKGTST